MARIMHTTSSLRLWPMLGIGLLIGCEVDPLQSPDQEFTLVIRPESAEVDVADELNLTAVAMSLEGDTLALPLVWSVVGDSGAAVTANSGNKEKLTIGQFVGRQPGEWAVAVEDPNGLVATARIRVRRRIRFDRVSMEQIHQAPDTAVVRYEVFGRWSTRLACVDVQLVRLAPGVHLERMDCPSHVRIRNDLMVVDPSTRETLDPRQLVEDVKFSALQETLAQVLSSRRAVPWWGGA